MKPEYIIVHHTGVEEKNALQVKRYHMSLGWQDVGYNFLIERKGKVVKGRDLSLPGAHCKAGGMNRKSVGVAVIGNLEEHAPSRQAYEALVKLCVRLCGDTGIPPERVLGHREVPGAATDCPGKFLAMDAVREEVRKHRNKGLSTYL